MLRRSLARPPIVLASLLPGTYAVGVSPALVMPQRHSAGKVVVFDHSSCYEHRPSAADSAAVAAQQHRVVNGYVPGKLFMRHWIAGEQSAVSIGNRIISLAVTFALIWAAGAYGPLLGAGGANGVSFLGSSAFVGFALWLTLHTHMNQFVIAAAAMYVVGIFFW